MEGHETGLEMEDSNGSVPVRQSRRSSSQTPRHSSSSYGRRPYRRDSNMSTSSFMDDVEMAHDEVSNACPNFLKTANGGM